MRSLGQLSSSASHDRDQLLEVGSKRPCGVSVPLRSTESYVITLQYHVLDRKRQTHDIIQVVIMIREEVVVVTVLEEFSL